MDVAVVVGAGEASERRGVVVRVRLVVVVVVVVIGDGVRARRYTMRSVFWVMGARSGVGCIAHDARSGVSRTQCVAIAVGCWLYMGCGWRCNTVFGSVTIQDQSRAPCGSGGILRCGCACGSSAFYGRPMDNDL